MGRANARTSWVWAAGGVAASCLLAVAVGAPLAGYAAPFSLPMGSPPKDIWNGPAGNRVAAKVSVSSGSVKVNKIAAATSFTPLMTGVQCVFEGGFDKLSIEGTSFPAEGSSEYRLMSQHTASDRLVGEGSISFPGGGGTVGFYDSDLASRRLASVTATGGVVGLRSSRMGSNLVSIDAGDWSCAILSNATGYFLNTSGSATAAFAIQDVSATCGPFSGVLRGQTGDNDSISLDGTCPVSVTLQNAGPATVTVTHVLNGTPTSEAVAPGATLTTPPGALSQYTWTYSGGLTTVNLSVSIQ